MTLWKRTLFALALVAGAAVWCPPAAHAGPLQITFSETGFADVTITDGQAGGDEAPGTNNITLFGFSFGGYTIDTTGTSSNNPGSAALARLSLSNTQIANTG